jgi:hypothetical protein
MDDVMDSRAHLPPFNSGNPMISIPQNQWAEQQQRLVTLEASLRLQKETIDRLLSGDERLSLVIHIDIDLAGLIAI